MKLLKKVIIIFTAISLFLSSSILASAIAEKSKRTQEMKIALEKAMELTMKNIITDPVYFADSNEHLIADVTQNFIIQLDSEVQELTIKIIDVDYLTGLLDIEATQTFRYPGGKLGEISVRKTIIAENI